MVAHFSRQITFEHWNWMLVIRGGGHLCLEQEKWPTRLQPMPAFHSQAQTWPAVAPFVFTHPPPPVPPFLLTQNLSPKDILTLYQPMMHVCIMRLSPS